MGARAWRDQEANWPCPSNFRAKLEKNSVCRYIRKFGVLQAVSAPHAPRVFRTCGFYHKQFMKILRQLANFQKVVTLKLENWNQIARGRPCCFHLITLYIETFDHTLHLNSLAIGFEGAGVEPPRLPADLSYRRTSKRCFTTTLTTCKLNEEIKIM